MVHAIRPSERSEPIDYASEPDGARGIPIGTQILRILRGLMLILLAALSFALCWVVGLMLGIF